MATLSGGIAQFRRISQVSLREQARSAIRAGVVTGQFQPAQLYSIGLVAAQLGVSATPVREALVDLATEGLVEVRRNRGFLVPELTDHDLDELFQLRMILEVAACELLVGHVGPEQLGRCWELEEAIEECARKTDLAGFLEADRDFHLYLLSLANNERLVDIVGRLRDQTRLYGLPQLALVGRLQESAVEHGHIVQALERKDAAALIHALRRHITHTRGLWAGRPERPDHSNGGKPVPISRIQQSS